MKDFLSSFADSSQLESGYRNKKASAVFPEIPIMRFSVLALLPLVCGVAFAAEEPLKLVKTIPLKGVDGKLDHLAVDAKGEMLYVANKPNNTLDVVDLKSGKMVKQIADQGKVSGVCVADDLGLVFVSNGAGVCNAFKIKDFESAFSAKAPGADNVHYCPDAKMVFVGHGEKLTIADAKTGEIKNTIALPGAIHGFALDSKLKKAFTVLTKPSVIAVVDLAKGEVTEKFPLTKSDAGSPIAYDAEHSKLFVGCPKKPMLIVFDSKTGKELEGIEIPGGVDDVHFDAKLDRVYASCGDGFLTVIGKKAKSEKYEVLAKLETPKFCRTCVFADGKLYLGVPKGDGREGPEVRVYEAK